MPPGGERHEGTSLRGSTPFVAGSKRPSVGKARNETAPKRPSGDRASEREWPAEGTTPEGPRANRGKKRYADSF